MEQTKVLVIANDYTTLYNFRLELLRRMADEGYDVTLALPHDDRNSVFEKFGCKIETIPLSRFGTNPVADMKTTAVLYKLIKKIKPHAVLTYTAKANIYGGLAARLTRTPYIANVTGLGANFEKQNVIAKIMLLLQKIAYKKARVVFFQNSSNKELFTGKKIVKGRTQLLPGSGVNLEDNPFEEYPENEVIKFITVARIRQDKGYDELFEVIRRLKGNKVPAEFHIVGWYEDEKYKTVVDEMTSKYAVRFYENMPHEKVHNLIKECDCLLQPSHHEGMSNVVLEAAAAGRLCIASDIPGCREGVDDGKTGFCFDVKNVDDFYDKAVKLINLPQETRAKMAKNAREKMEKQFDRNIVVETYIKEIKNIREEA